MFLVLSTPPFYMYYLNQCLPQLHGIDIIIFKDIIIFEEMEHFLVSHSF